MATTRENIPLGEVSERLAREGIDPNTRVTVLIDESMADVITRIRREAQQRGMTQEEYEEIMRSLS